MEQTSGSPEADAGATGTPEAPAPRPPSWLESDPIQSLKAWFRDYFLERDPTFLAALGPFLAVALVLFSRWPGTNYIFDEQEALLANPYVNATGGLKYVDAIHRDFWGLPPDRSIGSYRPIPDFLWRALWQLSKKSDGLFRQPFIHHIYNVFFHAINAAIVTMVVFAWTRRRGQAYVAGLVFVTCAVLTEAVSGIVGIADVLGGLGALLAVASLSLPAWAMPFAVFTAISFGLFSKESALVCVPLVPVAALVAAPLTHPTRPARFARAALAFVASAAAFYIYVELRRRWFPSPLPKELLEAIPDDASWSTRAAHDFLVWFHQAPLPKDPLNNPLANTDLHSRIAGALRVYFRGLVQIVLPKALSGDYSFPQEPVPDRLVFPESVAGAALTILPPAASVGVWIVAMLRERKARRERRGARLDEAPDEARRRRIQRLAGLGLVLIALSLLTAALYLFPPGTAAGHIGRWPWSVAVPLVVSPLLLLGLGLVIEGLPRLPPPLPVAAEPGASPEWPTFAAPALIAIGMTWVVVAYFPHSNIPVVLPTVRAERFWYFPAIGTTLILAVLTTFFDDAARRRGARRLVPALFGGFILLQGIQAYRHAMDYRSDLDFWRATKQAVPNSAKAHLNYSVMKGARGDLKTRLEESQIALQLAPNWAMAHIYTGDTLCRMHRAPEAWPHYKEGFLIGQNDLSLIALALQCLYDEKELMAHEDELRTIAGEHDGTWIAYLAADTLNNHEKNKGVDPKYRPRGYNEGPKD